MGHMTLAQLEPGPTGPAHTNKCDTCNANCDTRNAKCDPCNL